MWVNCHNLRDFKLVLELMSLYRNLFLQYQAQTSPSPLLLEVAAAEGVYLIDPQGKKYIDLISGISVSNVGHCAPEVVAAVQTQVATFMHTFVYGEFVMGPPALFAQKLVESLANELQVVYFVNSGAEATEGAIKVAKKYTGRHKFVAFQNSYHGSSTGALSISGTDWIKEGYSPLLPGVKHIRYNHFEDLLHITHETAAVFIEIVQAEAGVRMPEKGYLEAVRKRCDETGALLVVDEIQTGMGRTGSLFAHQWAGIQPDIILLAKGLGGGMPIGAFVGKRDIMEVISHNPILGHITTFGGHPVCCAAGLAALNKILDEKLLDQIFAKEQLIINTLQHTSIRKIRGKGLLFAVELDNFDNVLKIVHTAMQKGVIIDWFLSCDNALRIAPPLTISLEELKMALEVVWESIDEVMSVV